MATPVSCCTCFFFLLLLTLMSISCDNPATTGTTIVNGHIVADDTYKTSQKRVFKVDTVEVESTLIAGKEFPYDQGSQYTREFIAGAYDSIVIEKTVSRRNRKTSSHPSPDSMIHYTIERTAYKDIQLIKCHFHPFINALHVAYQLHLPFVISPDMIWLMIAQGFATHVGLHAEELREQFVDFEGEKLIAIHSKDYHVLGNPHYDWEWLFEQFSDSIEANTGPDLLDLVTGSFSTTTPIEKAAFQITLMDAMSDFFDYLFYTLCGIPEIILEGTEEDWRQIETRAEALAHYGLEEWIATLRPILKEFTSAAAGGEINTLFWRGIYSDLSRTSGTDITHLTGWMT